MSADAKWQSMQAEILAGSLSRTLAHVRDALYRQPELQRHAEDVFAEVARLGAAVHRLRRAVEAGGAVPHEIAERAP